uniref:MFS transporter n=1 Tax=Cyberlindnera americana TaxID=36016 RepID=A0A5P8N8F5_9ASCO|nr:MFS transporter [Cyberlindnera americana]
MSHSIEPLSTADQAIRHLEHTIELSNRNTSRETVEDEIEYPEGGFRAYLTVFGSFMGLIPAFGLLNAVGSIEAYVSSHQLSNVSTSTVSWIFSIYTFVTFCSQIFSGAFFDRNGSFKPMLIGTIAFCGGLMITANSKTVFQFIMGFGLITGFGNGMLAAPLVGVVSHYFNEKRGIATSIATAGGSIGGITMSIMLKELFTAVGFQWSLRILSFFSLFCCLMALTFAKERFRQDNEPIKGWRSFIKVYFVDIVDFSSFKDLRFLLCSLGCAFAETSLVITGIYFPSYAIKRGFNEGVAYILVTIINSTGVLGRYIPAYFADKYLGRFNVCIVTISICAILLLTLWLPFGEHLKVLYTFAALFGFFSGSILSLTPVCIGQISRTEEFGKRYATMYVVVSMLMLSGIPAAGGIIGNGNIQRYNWFIVYVSVLFGLGSLGYFGSRYISVGTKLIKF